MRGRDRQPMILSEHESMQGHLLGDGPHGAQASQVIGPVVGVVFKSNLRRAKLDGCRQIDTLENLAHVLVLIHPRLAVVAGRKIGELTNNCAIGLASQVALARILKLLLPVAQPSLCAGDSPRCWHRREDRLGGKGGVKNLYAETYISIEQIIKQVNASLRV